MLKKPNLVEFVDTTNSVPEKYWPKPAKFVLPEWYKKTPSYMGVKKEVDRTAGGRNTNSTIKKCVPVFDALTSGYIIFSTSDLDIASVNGERVFTWSQDEAMISSHPPGQVTFHPLVGGEEAIPVPKWINPWSIRTPKGYSCLLVSPFHRDSLFHTLEGVVDTDTYTNPVHFPFHINDPEWEGIIPAGTPIMQVIPFKREEYRHSIKARKDLSVDYIGKAYKSLVAVFFNSYRDTFWFKKEYN